MTHTWLSLFFFLSLCSSLFSATEEQYLASRQTHLYYPESKRIAVTYTWNDGKIVMREAFAYTPYGTIGLVSTDDGGEIDINNLAGATFKKILYMTPNKDFPLGPPEKVEEKVIDLQTNQEYLIKASKHYFSSQGQLIKQEVFDANNHLVASREWGYDSDGNMIKQVNDLGCEIIWGYDSNGKRILEKGLGKYKEIAFDASGRIIREDEIHGEKILSRHYRYDLTGRKIGETDLYGNETNFIFDALGNLTQIIGPTVQDENGKNVRPITMYTYKDKKCVKEIDPKGNAKEYIYANESQEKPSQIIYSNGSKEAFEYNEVGDICKKVKDGFTTLIERDFKGRIIKLQHIAPSGQILWTSTAEYSTFFMMSETDPNGIKTEYSYDFRGRNIKKVRGNEITTFEYDGKGRLVKEIKEIEGEEPLFIFYAYDIVDRLIEERKEDSKGNILKHKKTVFNERDLPTQIITFCGEESGITNIEYDSFGMKKITDSFGNTTAEYSDFDYKNVQGLKVPYKEVIHPCGLKTITIQDALLREKEVIRQDASGKTLHRKENFYDVLGNLCRIKEIVSFPNGLTKEFETSYEYDSSHCCVAEIVGANTNKPKRTEYKYNSLGKIAEIVKPSGLKLFYKYTPEGLLGSCSSSDNSISYSFDYDSKFRLTSIKDKNQNTNLLTYNSQGQLTQELLSNGLAIGYEYDKNNHIVAKYLPDGSKLLYKYTHDLIDKIEKQASNGAIEYSHAYNKYSFGCPIYETLLDRAGQLVKSYDSFGNLKFVEANHYTEYVANDGWNAMRNIIKSVVKDCCGEQESSYSYNLLGKKVREDGHKYAYDSSGNLFCKDEILYTYDEYQKLVKVGNKEFTYDTDGNLLSDGQAHYRYDAWGRLINVKKGKLNVDYTYDVFNRRMTKSIKSFQGTQEYSFLYDGIDEIASYTDGKQEELKVLGLNAIVAIELKGKAFVPIHGLSGSVNALLNNAGNLVEGYRFLSLGEENVFDSSGRKKPPVNPWRYLGERFDKESGLYCMYGKYYNPSYGIYLGENSNKFYLKDIKIAEGQCVSCFSKNNPAVILNP